MKALVTGASGFIGSTLIEELDTLGFEVHALMRRNSSSVNLEGLQYRRVEGDLSDFESLRRAVQEVDYVFHLAGVVAASNRNGYFEHNAYGTERLAKAIVESRPHLTRFIYVSSLAAGGPAQSLQPRTESEADRPVSNYGQSKLQGEKLLLNYKDVFPISIIRPPLVYGPKDKAVFLIIKTIARNLMPILKGSNPTGQKYYSAIHAKDLCRGIVQAAVVSTKKVASGETFYLTGEGIHSYQEFLMTIAERLNCDPLKIKVPQSAVALAAWGLTALGLLTKKSFPLNLDKLNELSPDYWICSNEKAKSVLGFVPEFDLASGMANSIEWYRRQKWI
jgi:nucleoside-diphosphate-sugar epimerase